MVSARMRIIRVGCDGDYWTSEVVIRPAGVLTIVRLTRTSPTSGVDCGVHSTTSLLQGGEVFPVLTWRIVNDTSGRRNIGDTRVPDCIENRRISQWLVCLSPGRGMLVQVLVQSIGSPALHESHDARMRLRICRQYYDYGARATGEPFYSHLD